MELNNKKKITIGVIVVALLCLGLFSCNINSQESIKSDKVKEKTNEKSNTNKKTKENKKNSTNDKGESKLEAKKEKKTSKNKTEKVDDKKDVKEVNIKQKQNTSKIEEKQKNEGKVESKPNAKPQNESKPQPENKPKPTPKPDSKPKPKPDNKPQKHEHNWVAKTIHHEEKGHWENVLVQPAWDEKELIERSICNQCNVDITGSEYEHNNIHLMAHEKGGWHSEWIESGNVIHHEAVYEEEWVVDQEAWDETYYVCSECGEKQ